MRVCPSLCVRVCLCVCVYVCENVSSGHDSNVLIELEYISPRKKKIFITAAAVVKTRVNHFVYIENIYRINSNKYHIITLGE